MNLSAVRQLKCVKTTAYAQTIRLIELNMSRKEKKYFKQNVIFQNPDRTEAAGRGRRLQRVGGKEVA